jgi:hypothetical protein
MRRPADHGCAIVRGPLARTVSIRKEEIAMSHVNSIGSFRSSLFVKLAIGAVALGASASLAHANGYARSLTGTKAMDGTGHWIRPDHVAPAGPRNGLEASFTYDIDLTGYKANGSFSDVTNTTTNHTLIPSAYITGVEWINLNFDTFNGSYRSEFVISTNDSANLGSAGTFWDHSPAPTLTSSGNYTGSGAFTNPSNRFSSGPFQLLPDGVLTVYVWDSFDDTGNDETVNSGTLRITYSDVAPPPPPAPTTIYTGSLASTDPVFNRPSGLASLSGVGTAVYHDAQPFYVGTSGTYVFEQRSTAIDSYFFIYSPTFNAASPLTSLIALDDDGGVAAGDSLITLSLTAGVQYYFVNSSFDNAEVGDYTVLGAAANPGLVTLGVIGVPEPTTLFAICAAGAMGLARRRRR